MATAILAKAAKKDVWYATPKGTIVRRIGAGLTAQGNVKFEKEDGDEIKLPASLKLIMTDTSDEEEPTKPGKKGKKSPPADDADDEMAELRREHERLSKGGGGGGGNDLDELEFGDNERYILRLGEETGKRFHLAVRAHYFRATDDDDEGNLVIVRCMSVGQKRDLKPNGCEFCKDMIKHVMRVNKKYRRGSDDGKDAYKRVMQKWAYQEKFLIGTYNAETDEVKVLTAGPKIMNDLLTLFFDQKVGDFTDPETGRPVNIKKKRTGKAKRDVEYQVIPLDRAELPNAEEVLEKRVDLEKLADALFPKYDAEEQRAFIEGKTLDEDQSSDQNSDTSSNDDGPPDDGEDDAVEPIAAEDAKKGRWYQTSKGFVGQAKGLTPKGNYKFVAADGETKLLTPTAQVTETDAPEADDDGDDDQEDE